MGKLINITTGAAIPGQNGYRLTLTSATPVTTSDVTAAGTIYWTPYKGNVASLFDGAVWQTYSEGELSKALTVTTGKNYDVFVDYNGGTPQLALVEWTGDTSRATALTKQDGVLVLTGATDHLYVGTIRASSTNVTEDSAGGTATNVGGKRFVWNYYNRVRRELTVIDTANTWSYATATIREANAATALGGNRVQFVLGVSEDAVMASLQAQVFMQSSSVPKSGIGLDSTSTFVRFAANAFSGSTAATLTLASSYRGLPAAGFHYLSWNEAGSGAGTLTWSGDNNDPGGAQSGLTAEVWA